MDLTARLLRFAAHRPHALVVAVPGYAAVRIAVEAALARRAWPLADTPADADLLVVAGLPGPGLGPVVERVWRQMPAPRALVQTLDAAGAEAALDAGAAQLCDPAHQRQQCDIPEVQRQQCHIADVPEEHPGHEHTSHEPPTHEHSAHDGGHHMHHGGVVAGFPMAGLGEDRDGLALDRLHVPLGPVLPDWPAGLVLHLTLQGDVVQEATAEVLDAAADPPGDPLVRELDALARFLGVAGWDAVAARARRLRDEVVAGRAPDGVTALVRQVRRSRTLWWQVRRLPAGPTDVAALLHQRLAAVEAALDGRDVPHRPTVAEAADLVVGAELAAARLVVAALDPVAVAVPHA